tara:strand:+ start:46 stop:609 length:564 start_codon:yes stop_codon:yes gene_type:complete
MKSEQFGTAFDCQLPDSSEKFCGTCKTVKFAEEFNLRSDSHDGRAYKCKDCTKLYNQKRYAVQRDHSRMHGLCSDLGCDTIVYFSSNLCEEHYYKKTSFGAMGCSKYWKVLQEKAYAQHMICVITGDDLIPGDNMSLDHIKPKSVYPELRGEESNVQWVTKWVNIAKWNLDMDEFVRRCVNIANRHN